MGYVSILKEKEDNKQTTDDLPLKVIHQGYIIDMFTRYFLNKYPSLEEVE